MVYEPTPPQSPHRVGRVALLHPSFVGGGFRRQFNSHNMVMGTDASSVDLRFLREEDTEVVYLPAHLPHGLSVGGGRHFPRGYESDTPVIPESGLH